MGKPVLVGVPLAPNSQIDYRLMKQLEDWSRTDGVETTYQASSYVCTGRERILKTACYRIPGHSHILFVDHDVLPRHNTLERLLAHDKDIVCGIYPMSQSGKISWCLSKDDPYVPMPINDLPDNPFKANYVGCGMMLVKMEVFENLKWPYWKDEYAPTKKMLGEDLYFCKKVREAGYDIWVDPKVQCSHIRSVDLLSITRNYIKE